MLNKRKVESVVRIHVDGTKTSLHCLKLHGMMNSGDKYGGSKSNDFAIIYDHNTPAEFMANDNWYKEDARALFDRMTTQIPHGTIDELAKMFFKNRQHFYEEVVHASTETSPIPKQKIS